MATAGPVAHDGTMTRLDSAERTAKYRDVWASRQFRVLFGSRSLGTLADTLRMVALSVLIYGATGSPALAALTYGISFLPQLFGASLFGALTDRIRPRPLIASGYLAEAAAGTVLGLIPLPTWGSLLLLAAVAGVTPVFTGASSRVVAEVLHGDTYVLGRSLSNLASSVAQLLGLTGAGFAVAAFGDRRALLCSAAGHLVASAWVRLRLADHAAPPRAERSGSAVGESWQGNLALLRDRPVRILLLTQWLPPAMLAGVDSLIVPYTGDRGFPHGTAGWLLAAVPVGMILGNFVIGRLVSPAGRVRLVPALVALMGVPCVAFLGDSVWPVIAVALVAVGVGFTYSLGVQHRFRALVPPGHRGQAFSLLATGLMTAQGVCPAVAGLAAQALSTTGVIVALGATTVVMAIAVQITFPATEPGRPTPEEFR